MYAKRNLGVIFLESVRNLRRQFHTHIDCIPIPMDLYHTASGFFKVSFVFVNCVCCVCVCDACMCGMYVCAMLVCTASALHLTVSLITLLPYSITYSLTYSLTHSLTVLRKPFSKATRLGQLIVSSLILVIRVYASAFQATFHISMWSLDVMVDLGMSLKMKIYSRNILDM